jgi:putative oxidoreductase
MNRFLTRYLPHIYEILRIFAGLMFAMHGTQKLFGVPGDKAPVAFLSLMGIGGAIEVIVGLLIALGLLTRYAAFIASGEMAVAYFMLHAAKGFWPIVNGGELAVLYCFVFLYIAARGPGIWSVDTGLARTSRNPALHS